MTSECEFLVEVTEDLVLQFSEMSGDLNPLHIDVNYAAESIFGERIAHGMLLMAYVSRVLGMHIPGKECLILSCKSQFRNPVPYPATLKVRGELVHSVSSDDIGQVGVQISNVDETVIYLDASVNFTRSKRRLDDELRVNHVFDAKLSVAAERSKMASQGGRLLITGGTGALGQEVVGELASRFPMTLLGRNFSRVGEESGFETVQVDLEDPTALTDALAALRPSDFRGVIHMSAPPPNVVNIVDDGEGLRKQLNHAVDVPLALSDWARHDTSNVSRLIFLGSQWGKQARAKVGAYSLAKATLHNLTPILASSLIGSGITVNSISMGPTDIGMNAGLTRREVLRLQGQNAIGRLVRPSDLFGLLNYMLSDESSALNGAVVDLDGASVYL